MEHGLFITGAIMTKTILTTLAICVFLTGCQSSNQFKDLPKKAQHHLKTSSLEQTNSHYANQRVLNIAGLDYPVSETSARLLVNATADAPELVADIFDGKGEKAVAGYKIMIINRTSSLLAETRKTHDGMVDNRLLHRGSKALIGIPVVAGISQLNQAVLLDLDIIYDDPKAELTDGRAVKERGQKLTKKDVAVHDKKVIVRSLTLPNYKTGETSGGGVDFEATATIDGKMVKTSANSSFQIFYTAKADNARGF